MSVGIEIIFLPSGKLKCNYFVVLIYFVASNAWFRLMWFDFFAVFG